ncbi:peptidylprolyl isomerase [Paludibacterium yongneupense]|uniref:peptidylprolyl isomerase n=1 Tax=Paludibacterium yongneupense TaxID=400061 RepID=UPI0004129C6F|nr:peptidylprolyl isomerase [Paludibacterium yongneupense]
MNKKLLISTLVAAVLSSASMAADPTVNGTTISQARIDAVAAMMQGQQGQGQADESAGKPQDQARDQLITAEVLRQEAVRKGLDKQPDVRIELENLQAMTLARHLIQDYQKANPVTESDLKAEYDKLKAQMPVKKSYHAEHILVKTEAEARAIIVALKKGRQFERLAREKSLDTGSKANGGDLGWNDPESFVPEFSQAMVKLSKGQVTPQPIKTQFGWHVIKLDDIRTEEAPSLDSLRPQLEQRILGQRIDKYISDLKAKASIKLQ